MTIYDGRKSFYQWDLNQKVTSDKFQVGDKIHFDSRQHQIALATKTYMLGDKVVADVPNILLQTTTPVRVFRYVTDSTCSRTVDEYTFLVKERQQPPDYFYTETELYELRSEVESIANEASTLLVQTQEAEAIRQENEVARIDAETARLEAETKRASAETLRINAETKRITAETQRVADESERQTAETQRQSAEEVRQAAFEQSYNNVANALKGSASGEIVSVDDVSPVEHLVKVVIGGKNKCNPNDFVIIGGGTFIIDGGTITLNARSEMYGVKLSGAILEVGKTYSFSFTNMTDKLNGSWGWRLFYEDGTYSNLSCANTLTILIQKQVNTILLYCGVPYKGNKNIVISDIQIEEGTSTTEYTPYIDPTTVTVTRYGVDDTDNPQTYTPSADGLCNVGSLSPTMTLVTDTAGVTIEAEYNRDINKVIEQLTNTINSLTKEG